MLTNLFKYSIHGKYDKVFKFSKSLSTHSIHFTDKVEKLISFDEIKESNNYPKLKSVKNVIAYKKQILDLDKRINRITNEYNTLKTNLDKNYLDLVDYCYGHHVPELQYFIKNMTEICESDKKILSNEYKKESLWLFTYNKHPFELKISHNTSYILSRWQYYKLKPYDLLHIYQQLNNIKCYNMIDNTFREKLEIQLFNLDNIIKNTNKHISYAIQDIEFENIIKQNKKSEKEITEEIVSRFEKMKDFTFLRDPFLVKSIEAYMSVFEKYPYLKMWVLVDGEFPNIFSEKPVNKPELKTIMKDDEVLECGHSHNSAVHTFAIMKDLLHDDVCNKWNLSVLKYLRFNGVNIPNEVNK